MKIRMLFEVTVPSPLTWTAKPPEANSEAWDPAVYAKYWAGHLKNGIISNTVEATQDNTLVEAKIVQFD